MHALVSLRLPKRSAIRICPGSPKALARRSRRRPKAHAVCRRCWHSRACRRSPIPTLTLAKKLKPEQKKRFNDLSAQLKEFDSLKPKPPLAADRDRQRLGGAADFRARRAGPGALRRKKSSPASSPSSIRPTRNSFRPPGKFDRPAYGACQLARRPEESLSPRASWSTASGRATSERASSPAAAISA